MQSARTGGWYDDDTYHKLLDMRQSCFIRKLQNRRKPHGSARIVLCREDGVGKGTISTEHSRNWSEEAMNWLRKLERLVLTFLKLLIALRVAGRLRGSWE